MTSPRARRRNAHLFSRYRLSGSALPFATWVKHDRAEQAQSDAIALPRSFWWAVGVVVGCIGLTVGIIGRTAGVW